MSGIVVSPVATSAPIAEARLASRARRFDDALRILDTVLQEAAACGDRELEAEAEALLATVYDAMQRISDAWAAEARVSALAEQLRQDRVTALAHLVRAGLFHTEQRTDLVESESHAARQAAERAGDPQLIGRADNLLAIAASIRGDASTALLRYGSALAHFTAAGDFHQVACVRLNIGTIQTEMGEGAAALEHFLAAEEAFRAASGPLYLAHAGHAEALAQLGRPAEALVAADAAVASAGDTNSRALSIAYLARGVASRAADSEDEATACLSVSSAIAEEVGDFLVGALAATELAAIHLEADRFGEAFAGLDRAARLYDALGAERARTRTLDRIDAVRRQASERLTAWVRETEARFPPTRGHAERVTALSVRLASRLRLSPEQRRWCELGALLHDIGYARLPLGAFTADLSESPLHRDVIRLHPVFGDQQLRQAGFPRVVREIARHHHERWDGGGYPDGLAGTSIPHLARVVAIVERYDALRSAREGMRKPLAEEEANKRLRAEAGGALDAALVEQFLDMLDSQPPPEAARSPGADEIISAAMADPTLLPGRPVPPSSRRRIAEVDLIQRVQAAIAPTYRIDGELTGGGMSRLFRATDTLLRRKVVVKVRSPDLGVEGAERFRREMAIAASLTHAHVVPVLNAGTIGDLNYFIMPFIRGDSIRARLSKGPIPASHAIRLLRDVADALAYAHARHVTHRDLKPENVLVEDERALLMDFGIARSESADPQRPSTSGHRVTGRGVGVGTPGYMSPEQVLGDAEPSPQMDVYAFGAMAFEMLAGVPPLTRETASALLLAHIYQVPASLATVCPDLPTPVIELVDRSLSKAATDRPRDGSALLDVLSSALG